MQIIQVITHSGIKTDIEVKDYKASEINKTLNSNEVNTVCIGNHIFSKIDIKYVGPLKD